MSWEVGDDEWLTQPSAVLGSGAIDAVDDRIIRALEPGELPQPVGEPQPAPATPSEPPPSDPPLSEAPVAAYDLSGEDLPPYSAAFDTNHEMPSYEGGSFVAEPEIDDSAVTSSFEAEPVSDFHIPTLSLGVVASPSSAEGEAEPSSPSSGSEPDPEPAAFVIPNLSMTAHVEAAAEFEDSVEEVEADELMEVEGEEIADPVPVRTGDTVIARAPEPDPEPVSAAPSITESVDDDDGSAMVIPELVERLDPGDLEVELMHEVTAVDYIPVDPDADTVVESAPKPEPEPEFEVEPAESGVSDEFVIPTLATPVENAPAEADDEEVVIPSLLLATSSDATEAGNSAEIEVADDVAIEDIAEEPDEDDFQEVEPEAIESLDSADLEEVEQPIAVGVAAEPSVEARPPAPPEVKPQAKRRKAWYDDVFAEHFLFLYPLTWEQTCQRDAQFISTALGGCEGLAVLDVGCGDGRHAVELAKLGAQVTGLDNSLALLLAAAQVKESAEIEDGRVEFIHGDMRRLPRDRDFDAVICIGTTLGYFEEDQNWLCLQEMHDRLRPGGRLLIHVFNRDFVAPHLPSRSWWQGKRCMIIDEAEMNFFANRLRVHRTIIFDDGRQYEHYMFMRAYTVQDLGKAISQLGMRVLEVSGSRDTRARFYGSASPDIWIVAEKK